MQHKQPMVKRWYFTVESPANRDVVGRSFVETFSDPLHKERYAPSRDLGIAGRVSGHPDQEHFTDGDLILTSRVMWIVEDTPPDTPFEQKIFRATTFSNHTYYFAYADADPIMRFYLDYLLQEFKG